MKFTLSLALQAQIIFQIKTRWQKQILLLPNKTPTRSGKNSNQLSDHSALFKNPKKVLIKKERGHKPRLTQKSLGYMLKCLKIWIVGSISTGIKMILKIKPITGHLNRAKSNWLQLKFRVVSVSNLPWK